MSGTPGQSSFEVAPTPTTANRPLLVWVILAFYLFSAAAWFVQSGTNRPTKRPHGRSRVRLYSVRLF